MAVTDPKLTVSQWEALQILQHRAENPSDRWGGFCFTSNANKPWYSFVAAGSVDRLAALGFAEQNPNRPGLWRITAAGRALLA